jgi:hypothetical protein
MLCTVAFCIITGKYYSHNQYICSELEYLQIKKNSNYPGTTFCYINAGTALCFLLSIHWGGSWWRAYKTFGQTMLPFLVPYGQYQWWSWEVLLEFKG